MPIIKVICPNCKHEADVEVEAIHLNAAKSLADGFASSKPKTKVKVKCTGQHRYKAMLFEKGQTYTVDSDVADHLLTDFPMRFKKVK